MRRPLAVVLAALAVAGCSHAKKKPPPAPLPILLPLVSPEKARVTALGFEGAELDVGTRIDNPNPTPLSAVRVEYTLDLEGSRAAQGTYAAALLVPAADAAGAPGSATLAMPVQLRFASVPGFARALAANGDAAYVLGGAVVFSTPAGEVRVPMSHAGRMPVPLPPHIRVEKVLLRSTSPKEIRLELRIEVENPNAFAIPPGRIACGLHLSGEEVVRADVPLEVIPGGQHAKVRVPVRISMLKAGKAAAKLLIPFTSLDVAVKGEAVFGGVPVPLDLASHIVPGS